MAELIVIMCLFLTIIVGVGVGGYFVIKKKDDETRLQDEKKVTPLVCVLDCNVYITNMKDHIRQEYPTYNITKFYDPVKVDNTTCSIEFDYKDSLNNMLKRKINVIFNK